MQIERKEDETEIAFKYGQLGTRDGTRRWIPTMTPPSSYGGSFFSRCVVGWDTVISGNVFIDKRRLYEKGELSSDSKNPLARDILGMLC